MLAHAPKWRYFAVDVCLIRGYFSSAYGKVSGNSSNADDKPNTRHTNHNNTRLTLCRFRRGRAVACQPYPIRMATVMVNSKGHEETAMTIPEYAERLANCISSPCLLLKRMLDILIFLSTADSTVRTTTPPPKKIPNDIH